MNKILKSLLVLGVVAVLAVGATRAFFSDTETSVGNLFQAGAIDLLVDSEGHYNGLECINDKWQTCREVLGTTDLIENGGFEVPEVTNSAQWELFSVIPGWTIEWESSQTTFGSATRPEPALQEYHEGVLGAAYEGNQYAELDTDWDGPSGSLTGEPALVKITQNIVTTPGAKYQLSWAFTPRPNTTSGNNTLKIRIEGVETTITEAGGGGMSWDVFTRDFTATDASTEIQFAGGGTADSLGVFLDAVKLVKYERECVPSTEFTQDCHSTWDLTNLGAVNKFFDFNDIKPGDYGENTISLHLNDNEGYACAYVRNYLDQEVSPATEPEVTAGDPDATPGAQGEIGQYVKFFAWLDDGDNVWEANEGQIAGPVSASEFLAGWTYGLYLPNTPMPAGTTKYVGVAWCAGNFVFAGNSWTCDGSLMGNQAQTDAISADIGFYVEQARNNSDFSCENILKPI